MQDAAVDRLSKILNDQQRDENPNKPKNTPQVKNALIHLRLAEGWFTFFLLALVVYSTIWCVQVVGWVAHLSTLSLVAALGLIYGMVVSKQQRLPGVLVHVLAGVLSLLIAFWQTSAAYYGGHALVFFHNVSTWIQLAFNGGTSTDNSIFLFLILTLGFLLAYTSTWLVYRTRSPWLMLIANAVVLLINLNNIDVAYVVFLIIFLIAALLLLLRFNLYESTTRWKHQGLRCSEELNWEFMQAGALISLTILVASWILPWGYTNQQVAQIWSANNNPWVQTQNLWNRLIAVNGGNNLQNHGNFANLLTLGGDPNLTNTPVFQVKTTDGTQYLMAVSFDQYDGVNSWSNSSQGVLADGPDVNYYDGSADLRQVNQTITVLNPPGEQAAYLFGASQIVSVNQTTQVVSNKADNQVTAWIRDNGKLAAGNVYTVTSYVSNADIQSLRTVLLPKDSPKQPPASSSVVPPTIFNPAVVTTYTKLPESLDARIRTLALQVTAGTSNMYDRVSALENYLRSNYTYDSQITAPPAGDEATSWFLFQSKRGFCNYFATAMTLLARELGIPARVAIGYTNGTFDSKQNLWTISGTQAHAWTQIYFAGYGWINFEPSATFSAFSRPLTPASSTPGTIVSPGIGTSTVTNHPGKTPPQNEDASGHNPGATGSAEGAAQVSQSIGIVLLVLLAFILGGLLYFGFWWRRLFRGLSVTSQVYGRVSLLANWAGIISKRSQTPYEYMQALSLTAPEDAITFERLGDVYSRERWADPNSSDHPGKTGEIVEIAGLWKSLQPRLFRYALRHPHFLRALPAYLSNVLRQLFRRPTRKATTLIVEEELL